MDYVDVGPMISALRAHPDHFEFTQGRLHHIPSRHSFLFDHLGLLRMEADCGCASLPVSKEQDVQLFQGFKDWSANYWRPLEINRQFAAHFAMPAWRRALIYLTGKLHRALLKASPHRHAEPAAVPQIR